MSRGEGTAARGAHREHKHSEQVLPELRFRFLAGPLFMHIHQVVNRLQLQGDERFCATLSLDILDAQLSKGTRDVQDKLSQ